jgi:uncharacterized integral membrane protein
MKILYRVVLLLLAIFLTSFSVSNRSTVSVGLWPLPYLADIPLYLLVFLSVLIGAFSGAAGAWLAARRELRRRRRRIQMLEQELAASRSRLQDHPGSPMISLPADN